MGPAHHVGIVPFGSSSASAEFTRKAGSWTIYGVGQQQDIQRVLTNCRRAREAYSRAGSGSTSRSHTWVGAGVVRQEWGGRGVAPSVSGAALR
jgi:hypothetical protein